MNEPHELFTSLVQASNSPQFKKNKQAVNMLKKLMAAHGYSTGGIVYANNGALIAARRGSDSVPAMLTPGEFVVNRQAAQQHMPLLQSINSGHMNHGGVVKYLAQGGVVAPKYYTDGGMAGGGSSSINMSGLSELAQAFKTLKDTFGSLENIKSLGDNI